MFVQSLRKWILWVWALFLVCESRLKREGISLFLQLEVDYSKRLMCVNVNFPHKLNIAWAVIWKKAYSMWNFFMTRVKLSHSSECLLNVCKLFSHKLFFVTVKIMKPVTTCGVLCGIYGKASVCVPICIEINEVHVACNILFAVSVSLIQFLKRGGGEAEPNSKNL